MGFSRTLNIAGRFANVGVGIPIALGHIEGLVLDQFQEATRRDSADIAGARSPSICTAPRR